MKVTAPSRRSRPATAWSAKFDLGKMLNAYRRNGVREYIVWRVLERQVDWFVNREGRFEPMPPSGRRHSSQHGVFPACGSILPPWVRGEKAMVQG